MTDCLLGPALVRERHNPWLTLLALLGGVILAAIIVGYGIVAYVAVALAFL